MINELYALAGSIADTGITTHEWHREYKPLPKVTNNNPCYRLWVSDSGEITGIEELSPEAASSLRKYGNNQGSFPAFNIKPLFRITDESQKKAIINLMNNPAERNHFDPQNLHLLDNNNWHKSMKKIDDTLRTVSQRFLTAIKDNEENDGAVVTKLIEAVSSMEGGLHFALTRFILSAFEKGEGSVLLFHILFNLGDESKNAADDMGDNISIVIDLESWDEYGYPVAHERTTEWINKALLRAGQTEAVVNGNTEKDAFGTFADLSQCEPMPAVKLPGFNVTLRAMYRGQPCQQRYGNFDDSSYPIARENRSVIAQALEWLADPKKEKTMWRRAGVDEIVFAYPSELTEMPVPIVDMFLPSAEDVEELKKARFEAAATDFLRIFDAAFPKNRPDYIRVFAIKKMDSARTKIVLTRDVAPQQFLKAVDDWQKGCLNAPPIRFANVGAPFPLKVPRIINTVWKRDGSRSTTNNAKVERVQPYQGVELLIDAYRDDATRYYLQILLENADGYVSHFGNTFHRGVYLNEYNARVASEIAALLGLFLYRSKQYKEDYMKDTPYLLGQILKVSDELHATYCEVERGGDIPPQLAGNSMFSYASEMPHKAIAQLGLRMTPYIAWAEKYKRLKVEKNDVPNWKAGWYLKLYQEIASSLNTELSEKDRFDDYGKAQLFLGYLADFPKLSKLEQKVLIDTDTANQEKENENE